MVFEYKPKLSEEYEALVEELDIEERRLKGSQGICSICGNDAEYADSENKICNDCWRKEKIIKVRERGKEKYGHLLGLKIKSIIVEWHTNDGLQAIELENGYVLEAEAEWEGGAYLGVSKRLQIPWNLLRIDSLESEEAS